ncbi:MAG: hypothetical protein IJ158_12535 [Treponema sp.]|nr:hypothetical protein [Treponema sp.]
MSTSLEKDLHSVYIDGEMPESFVSQYESLVSANEKEKSALSKMQKLHDLLKEDASEKTVSSDFMEESFARLQTKMRYAQNVSFAGEQKSFITPFVKYASSFAAAAAVFALVFIPVHYNSLSNAKETAIAAISIMKNKSIEPIAKNEVVVDGNISKEDLSKGLAVSETPVAKSDATESAAASTQNASAVEQKTIYATNLASNGGSRSMPYIHEDRNSINYQFRRNLPSVDVFAPDFSSSSISITINIPNFHEMGNNIEMMKE